MVFDDSLSDQIHGQAAPYSASRPQISSDSIYRRSNGLLSLEVARNGDVYKDSFSIGIQGYNIATRVDQSGRGPRPAGSQAAS